LFFALTVNVQSSPATGRWPAAVSEAMNGVPDLAGGRTPVPAAAVVVGAITVSVTVAVTVGAATVVVPEEEDEEPPQPAAASTTAMRAAAEARCTTPDGSEGTGRGRELAEGLLVSNTARLEHPTAGAAEVR
jgi:hypothetical protein